MRMSSRSLSVSAPADSPPPSLFRPFMSPSSPPVSTRVCTCVPSTPVTSSAISPSFEQQRVAGAHVARQRLVGDADDLVGAAVRVEGRRSSTKRLALAQRRRCRWRSARCGSSGRAGRRGCRRRARRARPPARTSSMRRACVVEAAVREIDAHQVDAGRDQVGHRALVVGRRTERRYDLGAPWHGFRPRRLSPAARCSSIATAGSVLPSTNSRNAPPPVEI